MMLPTFTVSRCLILSETVMLHIRQYMELAVALPSRVAAPATRGGGCLVARHGFT